MNKSKNNIAVVLLSILCFILTMILTSALLGTLTLRRYAINRTIPTAVSKISLKDITVRDDSGKNFSAAEYIMIYYIKDERVTLENIENLLEKGSFSDFAYTLAEKYNRFLLKEGDFPELKAEDFVELIEQNEDLIYQETGLEFLEPDKEKLRKNLDDTFQILNPVLDRSLNRGVSGFMVHSLFSVWLEAVLAVLLAGILVWMIFIYASRRRNVGTGLKVFSIAAFIPCFLELLSALILPMLLNWSGLKVLKTFCANLTAETLLFSIIGILGCAVLFGIGILFGIFAKHPEETEVPVYDAADFAGEAVQNSVPAIPDPPAPPSETVQRRFCRNCGQPLVNPDALFCYKCGNQQKKE